MALQWLKTNEVKQRKKSLKPKNVPITQEMLYGMQTHLKSDMNAIRIELKSEKKTLSNRIDKLVIKTDKLSAEVTDFKSDITNQFSDFKKEITDQLSDFRKDITYQFSTFKNGMAEQFSDLNDQLTLQLQEMKTMLYQQRVLMEEQNARNIYVLDQGNITSHKLNQLETRVAELEKFDKGLKEK